MSINPLALDAQGRLLIGADLDIDSAQSAANAQGQASTGTGFKRRVLFVTVTYSTTVTQNVTVFLLSALGAAWNNQLSVIALSTAQYGLWTPQHSEFVIAPGDQIQVTAPAGGGGVTSAIAIYSEIMGLTGRAVAATS